MTGYTGCISTASSGVRDDLVKLHSLSLKGIAGDMEALLDASNLQVRSELLPLFGKIFRSGFSI